MKKIILILEEDSSVTQRQVKYLRMARVQETPLQVRTDDKNTVVKKLSRRVTNSSIKAVLINIWQLHL